MRNPVSKLQTITNLFPLISNLFLEPLNPAAFHKPVISMDTK